MLTAMAARMPVGRIADAVVAAQRRGRDGARLLAALGVLHCPWMLRWIGRRCWGERTGSRLVALPTYAFQRQRYWLEAEKARRVTSRRWGCRRRSIRCLGAATPLADSERFLLTGRLSATEPGWLGDHAVFGTVLVPGTGLLELGFAAARAVGATTVSELMLVAPLVLPDDGAVRVQVQVDAPEAGEDGRRALSIFGRLEEAPEGSAWTLHAQGMLSAAEATASVSDAAGLESWPPVGGTAIDLTGLYSTLQAHGFGYGPAFQGLREAWRVGDAVYGRAVLPEALSESAEAYGVHPALLDAALHVLGLVDGGVARGSAGSLLLPFEWSEVSLLATGARELAGACVGGAQWRGRSVCRICSWPMAAGGRWRGLAGCGCGKRAKRKSARRRAARCSTCTVWTGVRWG